MGGVGARLFKQAVATYPVSVNNLDGDPACIVQAWEYAHLVGKVSLIFDSHGKVLHCAGTPQIPFVSTTTGFTPMLSDEDAASVKSFLESTGEFIAVVEDGPTKEKLDGYLANISDLHQEIIGKADTVFCRAEWPGQGESNLCEPSDTWAHGSHIAMLVTKAFLKVNPAADISIQQAGGVREDLDAGDISMDDCLSLLPFANTLLTLRMTGAQIKAVLEGALSYKLDQGGSDGSYPYAAGLRFHVDSSQPKGFRISNLEINPQLNGLWTALPPSETYTVVTNSFIAAGKEGYDEFASVDNSGIVDTFTEYSEGLIRYVRQTGIVSKLPISEYSTQKFIDAEDCDHSVYAFGRCSPSSPSAFLHQRSTRKAGIALRGSSHQK
jgi:5'-nucleotidase